MLGPRIKVKSLHCVSALTPQELCKATNEALAEGDNGKELQGVPVYVEECGEWIQFLVETVLVVPKEMMDQMGGPRIMPVSGKLPQG